MKNIINTELIKNYMKEKNLSKYAFCKTCKISTSTLERILNGEYFLLTAIFQIAKTINIDAYKLFND